MLKRKRPRYEKAKELDEDAYDIIGEEHKDNSPKSSRDIDKNGSTKLRLMGNLEDLKKDSTPEQ